VARKSGASWAWYLSNDNVNSHVAIPGYGENATDVPLVGDWDGNGTFTIGVARKSGASWAWYLSNDNVNSHVAIPGYGENATDVPLVGDWDGR
jgi:hypothetical protein